MHLKEERYLEEYVARFPIEDGADDGLVALKQDLTAAIVFDESRRLDRRPLLRHSAPETLRLGHGSCGDSARLATLALTKNGIRANRLYLLGTGWEHVAVEHLWRGGWVAFDAYSDATLMPDADVGRIPSGELERFPNENREWNTWERAVRTRFLFRVPASRADRWRPPALVVAIAERPYLLKALLFSALAPTLFAAGRRARRPAVPDA